MQEITKYTQENWDNTLRVFSKFAYDIDDESRIILGLIAKNGVSTETRITSLGKRRILLSRDKIRRRLLDTDLSEGFVSVKKGKKIGNLKGKREQLFSLTFKGLLASLYETKLSENYWIKNYISNIEKLSNKTISELFLQHMYYCIILYFLLNVKTKGSLTYYEASQKDIKSNYDLFGHLHHVVFSGTNVTGILSHYKDLFVSSAIEFYITCNTICHLLYDLKLPSNYLVNYVDFPQSPSRFITVFFEDWMYSIFDIAKKTPKQMFEELQDHLEQTESINFMNYLNNYPTQEIENLAKKSYLQLNPNGKFDPTRSLLFPKPF